MSSVADVANLIERARSRVDAKLALFDRAIFQSGGPEASPLDAEDEWEEVCSAFSDLDYVVSEHFQGAELAREDAIRDEAEAAAEDDGLLGSDDLWADHGFTVKDS